MSCTSSLCASATEGANDSDSTRPAGKPWAEVFDTLIWSKVRSDGPMQVHLSPDGIALVHGFMSKGLRDLVRLGMLCTDDWDQVATERVVTPAMLERTRSTQRTREFYRAGPSAEKFIERLGDDTVRAGDRQWDAIWDDGDFFKFGLNTQGIYVSPDRSLVIPDFSTDPRQTIKKHLRPLATSGLFDSAKVEMITTTLNHFADQSWIVRGTFHETLRNCLCTPVR